MNAEQAFERIQTLYENYGTGHYGEDVSQIQHAVQCGRLARDGGHSDDMVIAAFLHDVGHLLLHEMPEDQRDDVILRHQIVGADFLRQMGFSEDVVDLVLNHVIGKRYLTAIDPPYHDTLSAASKESLVFQGGPMTHDEVTAFETNPRRSEYLEIRRFDDLAKDSSDTDVDMTPFLDLVREHLNA